jgi:hypothetical protein
MLLAVKSVTASALSAAALGRILAAAAALDHLLVRLERRVR